METFVNQTTTNIEELVNVHWSGIESHLRCAGLIEHCGDTVGGQLCFETTELRQKQPLWAVWIVNFSWIWSPKNCIKASVVESWSCPQHQTWYYFVESNHGTDATPVPVKGIWKRFNVVAKVKNVQYIFVWECITANHAAQFQRRAFEGVCRCGQLALFVTSQQGVEGELDGEQI